jgi:hypothetical protein
MRLQQFQVSVVEQTKKQLPRGLQKFHARAHFALFKLHYAYPKVHYEVWVRGKERLIEIGLHFEADKAKNDALLEYFNKRSIEVHAALGPRVEIEQWTSSWSRVHEVVPYQSLDGELVKMVSSKLSVMIAVLEPMLRNGMRVKRALKHL